MCINVESEELGKARVGGFGITGGKKLGGHHAMQNLKTVWIINSIFLIHSFTKLNELVNLYRIAVSLVNKITEGKTLKLKLV